MSNVSTKRMYKLFAEILTKVSPEIKNEILGFNLTMTDKLKVIKQMNECPIVANLCHDLDSELVNLERVSGEWF